MVIQQLRKGRARCQRWRGGHGGRRKGPGRGDFFVFFGGTYGTCMDSYGNIYGNIYGNMWEMMEYGIWLVVSTPQLGWRHSQYMEKDPTCSKPPTICFFSGEENGEEKMEHLKISKQIWTILERPGWNTVKEVGKNWVKIWFFLWKIVLK